MEFCEIFVHVISQSNGYARSRLKHGFINIHRRESFLVSEIKFLILMQLATRLRSDLGPNLVKNLRFLSASVSVKFCAASVINFKLRTPRRRKNEERREKTNNYINPRDNDNIHKNGDKKQQQPPLHQRYHKIPQLRKDNKVISLVVFVHSPDPFAQTLASCGRRFNLLGIKFWVWDVLLSYPLHVSRWNVVL